MQVKTDMKEIRNLLLEIGEQVETRGKLISQLSVSASTVEHKVLASPCCSCMINSHHLPVTEQLRRPFR